MKTYKISRLTGKLYYCVNSEVTLVECNDNNQLYKDYLQTNLETIIVDNFDFEIIELQKKYLLEELTNVCTSLTSRSLISSVSKEGTEDFLKGQILRYESKYKVAKQYLIDGTIVNTDWYNSIIKEMQNTNAVYNYGLTIESFMNIIVEQYESGKFRSSRFETSIEIFRCKTKDLILNLEFDRAKNCLNLGNSIPYIFTTDDLEILLDKFDEL